MKLHSRENLPNIVEALKAQKERKSNKNLPPILHTPIHLQYDEIVNMPVALKRLYSNFDSSAVKVLLYDDIKSNILEVLRDTYKNSNLRMHEELGVQVNITNKKYLINEA